jgi:TusA-related sulfurtransferase
MRTKASVELDAGAKTFASGLLLELIEALRRTQPGDLIAVTSGEANVAAELEGWCRFTRNTLVDFGDEAGRRRWVVRNGEAPAETDVRPVGSRLWLYTNFDCNLRCDYCRVASSPKAPRRPLGLERVKQIAIEATALGVGEIFVASSSSTRPTRRSAAFYFDCFLLKDRCASPDQISLILAFPRRALILAVRDGDRANEDEIEIFSSSVTANDFPHDVLLYGRPSAANGPQWTIE